MKVLKSGVTPDGTDIQINEWHENYEFMPYGSEIAAYPKNKRGKSFRASCDFNSNAEAEKAFELLVTGKKALKDYNFSSLEPDGCKSVPFTYFI